MPRRRGSEHMRPVDGVVTVTSWERRWWSTSPDRPSPRCCSRRRPTRTKVRWFATRSARRCVSSRASRSPCPARTLRTFDSSPRLFGGDHLRGHRDDARRGHGFDVRGCRERRGGRHRSRRRDVRDVSSVRANPLGDGSRRERAGQRRDLQRVQRAAHQRAAGLALFRITPSRRRRRRSL